MRCYEKRFWCPWPESNQHSLRNSILSRARLPVPPQGPSDLGLGAAVAKPAEYSGQFLAVNPRGSDYAAPRQRHWSRIGRCYYRRPPVTLDTTANGPHEGFGANPALTAALAIAGIAAATL